LHISFLAYSSTPEVVAVHFIKMSVRFTKLHFVITQKIIVLKIANENHKFYQEGTKKDFIFEIWGFHWSDWNVRERYTLYSRGSLACLYEATWQDILKDNNNFQI
jgi:thymidylate synthase